MTDRPDQEAQWPMSDFHFEVTLGEEPLGVFAEVSALNSEIQFAEYRQGDEGNTFPKVPSPVKHDNLTLKRGVVPSSSSLLTWFSDALEGRVQARTLHIRLKDEQGQVVGSWTCDGAFPVSMQVTGEIQSDDSVAVESLVFQYRSLERSGS